MSEVSYIQLMMWKKKTPLSGVDKSLFHNRRTQLPNPTSVGLWLVLTHSPSPPCPWKQTSLLPRLKSMHSCVSWKSVKLCKSIMVSLHHGDTGGWNNSVILVYEEMVFFVNMTKQKASMQMHPLCMWNVFALSALMFTNEMVDGSHSWQTTARKMLVIAAD